MTVEVVLRPRSNAGLAAFIASLSDRSSPNFHRFLTPTQFRLRFAPPASERAHLVTSFSELGLQLRKASPDGLSFVLGGSAGAVRRAFGTQEQWVQLDGRVGRFYTNVMTPALAPSIRGPVTGVLGLSDLPSMFSHMVQYRRVTLAHPRQKGGPRLSDAASGPQPCVAAHNQALTDGTNTANSIASYYAMTPLYGLHDYGQGQSVGIIELEPNDPNDIAAYEACYGISNSVNYWSVNGGAGSGAGSGEAALDIENVLGLAPDARIDVYQSPQDDMSFYDDFSAFVNGPTGAGPIDQIGSVSWGECEALKDASDPGFIASLQPLFAQMATQGQTLFAASGDSGSEDCYPATNALGVDDPASQPYVLGVGGTSMAPSAETVWNDMDGATGGGVSTDWCMPGYQDSKAAPNLIDAYSVTDAAKCGTLDPYLREVPDVSALADPQTGYVIYYSGGWSSIGGTSAAAPVWAAIAALSDASPFCTYFKSETGVQSAIQATGLYGMQARGWWTNDFYDVHVGDNDFTGTNSGLFPTTAGFDMTTGLGTPITIGVNSKFQPNLDIPGLASTMCRYYATQNTTPKILAMSTHRARGNVRVHLTLTGSGFLPIAGVDIISIAGRSIAAACSSTTRCSAVIPPMPVGKYQVRLNVEQFAASAPGAGSQYSVVRQRR